MSNVKKLTLWQRFKAWKNRVFSKRFIHPVVDQRVHSAVQDKIAARQQKFQELKKEHDGVLANFLRTYFDREYDSELDQEVAFNVINKAWHKHVREVNSTSKIITLRKEAFVLECQAFIKKIKAKKAEAEAAETEKK